MRSFFPANTVCLSISYLNLPSVQSMMTKHLTSFGIVGKSSAVKSSMRNISSFQDVPFGRKAFACGIEISCCYLRVSMGC